MSPEVQAALSGLVEALKKEPESLGKVVVTDFEIKRYFGAIVPRATIEVVRELVLTMDRY